MAKVVNFLVGFLAGALVGGGIVTLLAPSSGDELRGQVKDYVQNAQDEVKKASAARREELEQQLSQLRKPAA